MIFGLDEKIGNVSYYDLMNQNNFHKPFSEETQRMMDTEVRAIIESQYVRALNLLAEKREQLDLLAKELLKNEVLFKDDLERIIGPRPFERKAEILNTSETIRDTELGDSIEGTTQENLSV